MDGNTPVKTLNSLALGCVFNNRLSRTGFIVCPSATPTPTIPDTQSHTQKHHDLQIHSGPFETSGNTGDMFGC
ncbi:hypothetical protein BaRGS_00033993 [Batillaria attramentaria]|uniref:Uncharacterized protein n=1 Tax=Batillaria attramentaria TaxID=370345 RepID=A0ABD0JIL4_9CAEN